MKFLIIIVLTLLSTSCSYKWAIITEGNKRFLIRDYKDYDDKDAYFAKLVFKKKYKPKVYSRYSGEIIIVNEDNFPEVQFDTVRVGIAPNAIKFIEIFSSGILNSEILYCTLDSLCRPPSPMQMRDAKTGEIVKRYKGKTYKNYINVGLIEEPEQLKISPQRRRFKLWVDTTEGGYGYDVVLVEITNLKVDSYVDIREFVKGASLTYIVRAWGII
ncbi:hypothetical protein I5M27_09150 [Adhaeribacter sp. BT258]|uniref:Lipoprotein n=1 Tax=Adhaeribacter terrigena TaxID=2793070 RepID=A0ABS1C166_9BACT|nr:hypothetical protein [Adhaeribacter terrigena]MBK0403150.1 hypothetical protein [Adhaeribacter terrigena]